VKLQLAGKADRGLLTPRRPARLRGCVIAQLRIPPLQSANMCSYMTSGGSPYARLVRAIGVGNLAIIEATAAELGWVALRDALAILLVIEAKDDDRFERSAIRWAGRLALEVPDLELAELAGALESLHALPDEHAQRSLLMLADRARRPRQRAAAASPPATRSSQQPRRRGLS
jgi:hypothetical protein